MFCNVRNCTILIKHQRSLGWSQVGPVVICHRSPVGVTSWCTEACHCLWDSVSEDCRLFCCIAGYLFYPVNRALVQCVDDLIQRSLLKTLPPLLPLHSSMLLALSSHASWRLGEFLGRKLLGRRLCANSIFLQPNPATERTGWFYCLHLVRRRISCD